MDFETFAGAIKFLAPKLLNEGEEILVERKNLESTKTLELRNVQFAVNSPFVFVIHPNYNISKLWLYSELLTEFLCLPSSLGEKYSSAGTQDFLKTFWTTQGIANYTYGRRWAHDRVFEKIVERLKKNIFTRQAVFNTYRNDFDLNKDEFNISCTLMHQFLIRHDKDGKLKLNLVVVYRSNDFTIGLKNDFFINAFFLNLMTTWLQLEDVDVSAGSITFFISSLHLYEKDLQKLKSLVETIDDIVVDTAYYPLSAENYSSPKEIFEDLWRVQEIEELSRSGNFNAAHALISQLKSLQTTDMGIKFYDKNVRDNEAVQNKNSSSE